MIKYRPAYGSLSGNCRDRDVTMQNCRDAAPCVLTFLREVAPTDDRAGVAVLLCSFTLCVDKSYFFQSVNSKEHEYVHMDLPLFLIANN